MPLSIGDIVTTIAGPVIPPIVTALLPLTIATVMVMAFILFILRRGWSGYRGLIGAAVFLVLAFGLFRAMLTGALTPRLA